LKAVAAVRPLEVSEPVGLMYRVLSAGDGGGVDVVTVGENRPVGVYTYGTPYSDCTLCPSTELMRYQ
jgi:hypothetical protein